MAENGAKRASPEYFQYLINSPESCVDDKVCIVGIFGKDNLGYKSKAVHLNGAIGKEVFKIDFLDSIFKKSDTHNFSCDIDIYHDVEQRIIYLHLVSVYDVSRLLQLCKQAPQEVSSAESHQYWMSHEFYYASALLFLFSVSHIIVMLHPSQTFDLDYIRLFRTLALTRRYFVKKLVQQIGTFKQHQLLPQISQLLSGVEGIPDIWRQTGRPCIPRLVCSLKQRVPFMDPSQMSGKNQDTYASKTKGKTQTVTSQKKLQHAIEDQMYSIMRKARLLGSLSSSSLFTVSSSHAFVHVQPWSAAFDPVMLLLNTLAKPAISSQWVESSPLLKNSSFLKKDVVSDSELVSPPEELLFKEYLKQQIDHLMTGDAGRDGVAEGRRGTHVEVPSCRLWARVSLVLFEFFLTPKAELLAPLTTMASQLDLDMKFSEARCRKAIPVATSTYLETLPSHYTHNVHLNQLSQALRVFSLHARGPAFGHYAAQLQEECNKVWLNGRQLCEERSLTGRHCVYPYHRVPADGEQQSSDTATEDCKELGIIPSKPHSSRITSLCACNCGRTQEHREDPFDLKAANVGFFQTLENKCCSSLVHLFFPCHPSFSSIRVAYKNFKATTDEVAVLELSVDAKSLPTEEGKSGTGIDEEHHNEELTENEGVPTSEATTSGSIPIPNAGTVGAAETVGSVSHSISSAYSASGYHSTLDIMGHEGPELKSVTSEFKSFVSVGIPGELSTEESQEGYTPAGEHLRPSGSLVKFPWRGQEKEHAFLETMLTNESPSGLLPRFSSWSLCRLGNSSTYSPSKGLEQPGFFPNSNFLLAWDIPLLNDSQDMTSQFDGQSKHLGSKQMADEAWPTLNELPSAGSSSFALPLYQALNYARRQCTDYKGNMPPLVVSATSGKGSSGGSRQRGRPQKEGAPPTVRVYVGEEYECPRGHRFICSGPDKMVKSTSSGHVKETAHKLVTSDMPLYFPCPCRSSKPLMAQMMRVFVVTPDSPVLITLNPRVQPSVPPCPFFYPGVSAGVSLPHGSFCVLRLPYVYVSEDGPILPPSDSQPLLSCRVLKGMFSAMGHSQSVARSTVERKP